MGKVNAMFQDEQEAIRQTEIMVEADVEIMYHNGYVDNKRLTDIPCVWVWDEMSREAAEYWAVWEYVGNSFTFEWMSIKSWVGSPVKKTEGEA